MNFLGIDVGPDGSLSADLLRQAGATMARVPLREHDMTPYLRSLTNRGITPLLCLDDAAYGGVGPGLTERLAVHAERYAAFCRYWEIGNEEDDHGAESSYLEPQQYSYLLHTARLVLPDSYLIVGGLSSGQDSYVKQIDHRPADGIGVHFWGQRPEPDSAPWERLPGNFGYIGDHIEKYRAFGKPVWLTEGGTIMVDPVFQADYCRAVLLEIARHDVEAAVWYCGRDWDSRHLGVTDMDGSPKPVLAAFADAARLIVGTQPAPPTPPSPEPSMPRFQQGFEMFHDAMPDVIGDPIRDEFGAYPGQSSQPTKKGVLVWTTGMGMAFYERRGRVWRWADGAQQPEEVVA